ncbi:MAG TPA: hypothetical protein V6D18_00475 [Thermosynechococcaceae cyanobacterium]
MSDINKTHEPDSNPDPITGESGSHPVGTGIGAAGAGAVATTIGGIVGGPVGAAVGAVVGAVAGGLAGKSVAEQIDPTAEDSYWRENYSSRPYAESGHEYSDYEPAYRTGYEGYSTYYSDGVTYDQAEPNLRRDYEAKHGPNAKVGWDKAKHAARDAWDRVERAVPGDADRDGK